MKKCKKALALLVLVSLLLPAFALGEKATAAYKKGTYDLDAEYIDLKNNTVSKDDMQAFMAFLRQFPNLKKVDMFNTRIGKKRIEELHDAFPEIEFGMTMILGTEHTVRTDATAFSTLHGYETFEHETEDFSILKYCKNLYALDVGHNYIDDLNLLYDLPKLRVLILAKNHLTDITPIASLHDLEYLEIFANNIVDVSPLENLTHLVDLNLTGNRIEDLSPLENVTTLRRLWLYNHNKYSTIGKVDKEAVAQLRAALPDAYIDDVNAGTDGAWRTVDHYYTIQRMFKSGVYEPFSDVQFDDYAYPFQPE